jgi:DNA-binding transcriptional LysR family regulator
MYRDLDHRLLRQFVAVAEERHFGRAAERLAMAQPPLSQAIRRLELDLGERLLERSRAGVALTPAGEALLVEARDILARLARAGRLARAAAAGPTGRVAVGFVSAALYAVLPAAVSRFREERPTATLAFAELPSPAQVEGLRDGTIDLGFVHPPLPVPGDAVLVGLGRDPLVAAVPAGHPLAAKPRVRFAELAVEPFVLFPEEQGPSLHAAILRAGFDAGVEVRVGQVAQRLHTQLSLVAAGLGVTLAPSAARTLRVVGTAWIAIEDTADRLYLELALLRRRRPGDLADCLAAAALEASPTARASARPGPTDQTPPPRAGPAPEPTA